jgi:hypothetical protein
MPRPQGLPPMSSLFEELDYRDTPIEPIRCAGGSIPC